MTQDQTKLNEAFVVTRHIPVSENGGGSLSAVAGRLQMYPGVALANVSADGHLEVRYDASRIGFEEIEQILNEAGLARPTNLASRIKSGWFRFTDDNVRANAHATHTCCSRPPVSPG